ncbi:MAG TPA: PAS domain S-box protein [Anaerolineales bacterium]|nr:PAS domain S-box protein [Anaerolineales bacterium]
MKPEPVHRVFRPLFDLEHREITSRFLYIFLFLSVLIELAVIILRLWLGEGLLSSTTIVLASLLVCQLILLWVVRQGYPDLAALILVIVAWMMTTFQAWSAGGVRDVALYVYILILIVAAFLTNWQVCLFLFVLSLGSIWFLAASEAWGLRGFHVDDPLRTAVDLTAIFTVVSMAIWLLLRMVSRSLDAVQHNEAKFRRIFHVSPVAIAITSQAQGQLLDANEAYWKLTGFDPGFALGKTTVELGMWSTDLEREQFMERLKQEKSFHSPAYRLKSQSGEYRTTLAFYELMEFENEPAVMAMFHDITDQKKAELALQASEQKYRDFVEQSMEGIWFVAFDQPIPISLPPEQQVELIYQSGYISECNDVLAHMYGYSSGDEMRGVRLLDLQPNREMSEINYRSALQLIQDGYRSGNRETKEQTRDGKIVYFLNNAIGMIEQKCLVGLWGTQLDITALKTAEEALRHSEARTRALLDAIPDMIFEFTRDGTIRQFVSSSGSRPLIPPDQFVGRKIGDVLPSVADQTMFAITRVLESGHVHAFEYQLAESDEKKTFEARFSPLSPDTVLAIVRDVSLQKWILGEREQLINELESKNAELERFTYTVSHDLKSPLITIKGFLGFLRQDAKSGNHVRFESDIQRISDAADKMQQLLNELLELSRIGRLVNQAEVINANEMIAEVLELLHGRIHAANIRVTVEENLPQMYGDRPRLFEVLQNLVDNAAKFMGDQPDPSIEIGTAGKTENGTPVFFIRDNGIGIDPRYKNRIFGLFDKLDARTDGTGIGLALAKRIIEFHRGRIWVESEPGKGATFFFSLPQAEHSSENTG